MAVIKVESLGKSYIIKHQGQKSDTLRDAITNSFKGFGRKIIQSNRTNIKEGKEEEFWALKDVSFEVNQGDRLGIIGRNGAGKSTLLKILSRITEPTNGRISIKGKVASLLEVGTGFHPELSGRENIFLNGAILGMTKAEIKRKFDEIVAFSEVENFLDTPVKRYSSGMHVRLAFAVAAHLEPEILLVDEVLAVGDVSFQKKCLGKMNDVAGEGRTVIFVSHNMAAIRGLCSRCVVLDKGRKIFDGDVAEAINCYVDVGISKDTRVIRDREDRRGSGEVKLVGMNLTNQKGLSTNQIELGDSFDVTLELEGELSKAVVGILIGNSYEPQLVRGYSYESCTNEININGKSTIKCSFKDFPLVQGNYIIQTWIGRIKGEEVDVMENAMDLSIISKDIYHTGKMLDATRTTAFCYHNWEIDGVKI